MSTHAVCLSSCVLHSQLSPVEVGQEVNINAFECLAIVPSNATKFDVKEMPHSDFMALANSQGVYVNLKK